MPPLDRKTFQQEQNRPQVPPLDRKTVQQEQIRRLVLPLDRNAVQQEQIRRQVPPLDRKALQQEQNRPQVPPLDRYEQICSSCIELRDRISHGESVPDAVVTELLGELGRLRSLMQNSEGTMSGGQRILAWKDLGGEWAKVTDFSWSGIGAETGITFTFKHIDIMAGACWMGGFSFLAGIGYAF